MSNNGTVTISLSEYKHMQDKIENLEKGITDLKNNKELVTWSRGHFTHGYWFYNPTDETIKIIRAMNDISSENQRLQAELKKVNRNAFYRFFRSDY